jgi:hypothetical protein
VGLREVGQGCTSSGIANWSKQSADAMVSKIFLTGVERVSVDSRLK